VPLSTCGADNVIAGAQWVWQGSDPVFGFRRQYLKVFRRISSYRGLVQRNFGAANEFADAVGILCFKKNVVGHNLIYFWAIF